MENENQEKIKKEIISELIIDELFQSLKKISSGKIEVESYKINEKNMTYLIEKYDPEKFKVFEKMLLKTDDKDE